jgi:hypothetical protein
MEKCHSFMCTFNRSCVCSQVFGQAAGAAISRSYEHYYQPIDLDWRCNLSHDERVLL